MNSLILHHHFGWPRRFGRYNFPRWIIVFFVYASVVDIYFALIFGCGNGKTVAFLNSQVVQDHILQAVQGPEQLRRTGGRSLPFWDHPRSLGKDDERLFRTFMKPSWKDLLISWSTTHHCPLIIPKIWPYFLGGVAGSLDSQDFPFRDCLLSLFIPFSGKKKRVNSTVLKSYVLQDDAAGNGIMKKWKK